MARQRLGVGDDLAALGMMERRGVGNLDGELVRAMRLPCRCIRPRGRAGNRPSPPSFWRCSPTRRASIKGEAEDLLERPIALDPAHDVARHPAHGAQGPQRPIGALELFGVGDSADGRSARVCRRARRIGVRSRHASWRAGSVARGRDASAWRRSETPSPWAAP